MGDSAVYLYLVARAQRSLITHLYHFDYVDIFNCLFYTVFCAAACSDAAIQVVVSAQGAQCI